MTGGGFPDGIRPVIEAHRSGDHDAAFVHYQHWLPLINHDNRQAGMLAAKALMKEGCVIACEAPRHPLPCRALPCRGSRPQCGRSVSDGLQPKRARYWAANRPMCRKPKDRATSVTLTGLAAWRAWLRASCTAWRRSWRA